MTRRRLAAITCALVVLLDSDVARAQSGIVIDWSTRTVVSSPSTLGSTLTTMLVLRNINDVLYDYEVDVTEVLRPVDDFGHIAGALGGGARGAASDPCSSAVDQIRSVARSASAALEAEPALTPKANQDGTFPSVRLSATVAAWNAAIAGHVDEARRLAFQVRQRIQECEPPSVTFLNEEFRAFDAAVRAIERRIAGPHLVQVPISLRPDADYTIVVTEKYNGVATADGTKKFVVSPASTLLTLSSGFGATWLEGRSYGAAPVPGANTGDPNQLQMRVDGKGIRPVVPLLLNYQLPKTSATDWGLALSGGPVLAFGSGTSNTSSLGFFGGISLHLFHRVLITPGIHLGEFADYPLGFTDGATIPDKFGDLTPTKRWTSRFAIMMTFRTLDFSKLVSKPQVQEEKPKPEGEKPKPEGEKPKTGGEKSK